MLSGVVEIRWNSTLLLLPSESSSFSGYHSPTKPFRNAKRAKGIKLGSCLWGLHSLVFETCLTGEGFCVKVPANLVPKAPKTHGAQHFEFWEPQRHEPDEHAALKKMQREPNNYAARSRLTFAQACRVSHVRVVREPGPRFKCLGQVTQVR